MEERQPSSEQNLEQQQGEQHQLWWQRNQRLLIIVGSVVIIVLIAFSLAVYKFGWDWTGFTGGESKITITPQGTNTEYSPGKTLWDWVQLLGVLAIPVVVGFGVAWITRTQQLRDQEHEKLQRERDQQLADQRVKSEQEAAERRAQTEREAAENRAQTEREIASDNQQEAALQAYIDKMSELLLHEKLRESDADSEVRKIARVRMLTVLPRLDNKRKKSLLLFLYESGLIDKDKCIIDLSGADLSGADLQGAYLRGAHLSKANLRGADLRGAHLSLTDLSSTDLSSTDLSTARLRFANLILADLSFADLSKVNLEEANLSGAKLSGANLRGALATNEQLARAKSFEGLIMPNGTTHP